MGRNIYSIKETKSKYLTQPVVLQNENGPCALLAIVNILVLKDTPMAACIHYQLEHGGVITEEELLLKIGEIASNSRADLVEQLFSVLPDLSQGLDVNPKFNGEFEEIPPIFTALNIKLLHGWILGYHEASEILGETDKNTLEPYIKENSVISYDRFCEIAVSDKPNIVLQLFVDEFPGQLTPSGYDHLLSAINENELAILFWNNHFSTVTKHQDNLYMLVTDVGMRKQEEVMWERIDLSGAGEFLNANFEEVSLESQNTNPQ